VNEPRSKINVPLLVASLVVSFVLWAAVYAQNLPVATRQVEVDLLRDGLNENQYAVLKSPDKLRVWVTGSEQQLNELRDMEKFGLVDLSRAAPGARTYPVALQPTLLRELAHDPVPEIRLDIQRILRRRIRVTPQTSGKLSSNDLRLDSLVLDPEAVTVSGPQSLVQQVAEARILFNLGEADPRRAAPHNLPVELVDSKGRRVQDVQVSPVFVAVTPVLQPAPEEKTASVLVRFKGSVASGYEQTAYTVDRDSVVLVGPSFALATVSSIETQPVDVTGLTAPKQFTVPLRLPPGVTSTRPTTIRVRVIVRRTPTAAASPSPAAPVAENTP
jgi:YbbR domain-containing protein